MSDGPKKPQYVATLRDCDTLDEIGALGTLYDARTNDDAVQIAKGLAAKWLTDNGVDLAILHVVKDGGTILNEEVRNNAHRS